MIHLGRHQEEADKEEHPLDRIVSMRKANRVVINTTLIHLRAALAR
jgi:hypothetical protein